METTPGDILLVHQKGQAVSYARVEDIQADHKPGWWHLSLLLLGLPAQEVTWILREEYIDGADFTMGGQEMRLQRLPRPRAWNPPSAPTPSQPEPGPSGGKVLTLRPRK